MNIIIAGGGKVGQTLARQLAAEGHDLTVIDQNRPHVINSANFKSLGHATPFDGWGVTADIAMTICDGEIVYSNLAEQE